MTLPSRKKHQTTPPSIREANPASGDRLDVLVGADEARMANDEIGDSSFVIRHTAHQDSTWLPAALLATLVLLAGALQALGGETQPLQWRPAFTPSKRPVHVPVQASTTSRRQPVVQQVQRAYHRPAAMATPAVVQASYNDAGDWSSTADTSTGSARVNTLIVHPRDPQFMGTGPAHRVAQDPFADDLNDELSRDIALPFGDEASADDMPELELEELPEPGASQLPDAGIEDMTDEPMTDDLDEFKQDDGQTMQDMLDDELFDNQSTDDQSSDDDRTMQPGRFETVPPSDTTQRRTIGAGPVGAKARELFEKERQKAAENCQLALAEAKDDRITRINLGIDITGREGWDYPFECTIDDGTMYAGRAWPEVTYMWKAAANCHKPLYFEQVELERYGHSWGPCVQPLVSGVHFFTRLPVLPYCMGITPPNECIYPLGYYRPGNCAPYMIPAVPFTWRAAAFQAGATVGTAAILP